MKTSDEMTENEKALIRAWVKNWQEVGPLLEEIRAEEIRAADTVRAMEVLDDMFNHAVKTMPARESSGLIEQQAIFARARR